MRLPLITTAVFLLTLTSLPVDAQAVTLRGKVEDVQGTQNLFFVDCTNVSITSGAFNLNLFLNQQVELTGNWNGSFVAPAVDVTAIVQVVESFEIGGGAKIGDVSNLSVTGPAGDVAVAYISTAPGFTPLGDLGVGLIHPTQSYLMGVGVIPPFGTRQFPLPIPNDPSLVGFELHGQGVILDVGAGQALLTNPDCKEIKD